MKKDKKLFCLLLALPFVLILLSALVSDIKPYGPENVFYTDSETVQKIHTEDGSVLAGICGWDYGEDYTDRTVKLIDKNSQQVKELELPSRVRDEYNGYFIGEEYVIAWTNQMFGVDRRGRLFNLDIYDYSGNRIKSDYFTTLARHEYIDDEYLRAVNLQYKFEWLDKNSFIMYGFFDIYKVNIPSGTVQKIIGMENLVPNLDYQKYMDIKDSRTPGEDSFIYGIIPFGDSYSKDHGFAFRVYDKLELNNASYKVYRYKDNRINQLTDSISYEKIYYNSSSGAVMYIDENDDLFINGKNAGKYERISDSLNFANLQKLDEGINISYINTDNLRIYEQFVENNESAPVIDSSCDEYIYLHSGLCINMETGETEVIKIETDSDILSSGYRIDMRQEKTGAPYRVEIVNEFIQE